MKKRQYRIAARALAAGVFLFGAALNAAAQMPGYIIKKSDPQRPMRGAIRYIASTRSYEVNVDGRMTYTVPRADVLDVKVQKPAQFDSSVALVRSGKYAEALSQLRQITVVYNGLGWDGEAARWLLECYLKLNKPDEAERIYDRMMETNPDIQLPEDLVRKYWDALISLKKFDKLERVISDLIGSGSRRLAAVSLLVRGDLRRKQGNLKEALVDGYLRAHLMFKDIREAQPEAVYKCMECFKELGQHQYAEKMRKILLADFPETSYGEKAKSQT